MTREKKTDYNYVFIQFKVSEDYKQEIKDFVEEEDFPSMSEFCRQAIEDKMRRIRNPELSSEGGIDASVLAKISQSLQKNTERIMKLQELEVRRDKTLEGIRDSLGLLREMSSKEELEEEIEQVTNLLKAHGALSPKEIMDKTQLGLNQVYTIIALSNELKTNSRGKVDL